MPAKEQPKNTPDDRKGKTLWQIIQDRGEKRTYQGESGPDDFWADCVAYFEWSVANDLKEAKAFSTKEGILKTDLSKLRAFTTEGLTAFIGIGIRTLNQWADPNNAAYRENMRPKIMDAKLVIREQKLTGAMAGLLNPMIVSRLEGLREGTDVELSGPENGPIETVNVNMSIEEKAEAFRLMVEKTHGKD